MKEILKLLRQTHIERGCSFPEPRVKLSYPFTEIQRSELRLNRDNRGVKSIVYWLKNYYDYCLIADMEKYFMIVSTDRIPDELIVPDERIIYARGESYTGFYGPSICLKGIVPINPLSRDLIVYTKIKGELSFDVINEFIEVNHKKGGDIK